MTSANRRPVEGSLIPLLLHGLSSTAPQPVFTKLEKIPAVEGNQHACGFTRLHPPHFVCLCVTERKAMYDLIE